MAEPTVINPKSESDVDMLAALEELRELNEKGASVYAPETEMNMEARYTLVDEEGALEVEMSYRGLPVNNFIGNIDEAIKAHQEYVDA